MRKLTEELDAQILSRRGKSENVEGRSTSGPPTNRQASWDDSPAKGEDARWWQQEAEACRDTLEVRTRLWEARQQDLLDKVQFQENQKVAKKSAVLEIMRAGEACSVETAQAWASAGHSTARIDALKRCLIEAQAARPRLPSGNSVASRSREAQDGPAGRAPALTALQLVIPSPGRISPPRTPGRGQRRHEGPSSARERLPDTDVEETEGRSARSLSPHRGHALPDGEVAPAGVMERQGLSRTASAGSGLLGLSMGVRDAIIARSASSKEAAVLRERVAHAEARMRDLQEEIRDVAQREKLLFEELNWVRYQIAEAQGRQQLNGDCSVSAQNMEDEEVAAAAAAVAAAEAAVAVADRLQSTSPPQVAPKMLSKSHPSSSSKSSLSGASSTSEVSRLKARHQAERKHAEEEAAALRRELRVLNSAYIRRSALPPELRTTRTRSTPTGLRPKIG